MGCPSSFYLSSLVSCACELAGVHSLTVADWELCADGALRNLPSEAQDVIYRGLMFHALAVMVAFIILLLGPPVLHLKDCVLRKWKSHTKAVGIF